MTNVTYISPPKANKTITIIIKNSKIIEMTSEKMDIFIPFKNPIGFLLLCLIIYPYRTAVEIIKAIKIRVRL